MSIVPMTSSTMNRPPMIERYFAIELDFIAYDIEDSKMTALDSLRSGVSLRGALHPLDQVAWTPV